MELNVAKRRRAMTSLGEIGGFSDMVQWTLPNFFSIDKSFLHEVDVAFPSPCGRYIQSPRFPLAGCDWRLRVFPKGRRTDGWVSANAKQYGEGIDYRNFTIGCKRADGLVEETVCRPSHIMPEDSMTYDSFLQFFSLDELEERKSELLPSGTLTLTFRVQRDEVVFASHRFRLLEDKHPFSISFGTVDHFSEVVRWWIPTPADDYIKLDILQSPPFTLAGYRWQLTLRPTYKGDVSVHVARECDDVRAGTTRRDCRVGTTFYVGLMRWDGVFKERKTGNTAEFIVERLEFSWGWPDFFTLDEISDDESKLMTLGVLGVSFRLELGGASTRLCGIPPALPVKRRLGEDVSKDQQTSQPTIPLDPETVFSDVQDVMGGDRRYDVTFDVQGKKFPAHRSLLSARSQVFRAMFEHDMAEAKTGVLEVPDCDRDTFEEFLRFLYTGKVRKVTKPSALTLYATSDKYDVEKLKNFCADYLAQTLTPGNFCAVVALADLHSDDRLFNSAWRFHIWNRFAILRNPAWTKLCEDNPRLADKFSLLRDK